MPNSIAYAKAYKNMLDRVYKETAATSILETNPELVDFNTKNANEVLIQKLTVQGLGDYSRANGYVGGTSTLTWETHTFNMDRGRKYPLDTMDENEAMLQIGKIMAEVQRVRISPEVDAYRFERLCTLHGSLDVSADLTNDTVIPAIDTAIDTLDNYEVPKGDRIMFCSNTVHSLLKQSADINQRIITGNSPVNGILNRNITMFDEMPLIRVPSARFKNNFDYYDGSTQGQEDGGFVAANGAKALNFIILSKAATIAIIKHQAPKLILPQNNADADGYLFAYRMYHDLFVPDNKVNGIYIHSAA